MSEETPDREPVTMSTDELIETFEDAGMREDVEELSQIIRQYFEDVEDMESFYLELAQGDVESACDRMGITVEEWQAALAEYRERASELAEEAGVFDHEK